MLGDSIRRRRGRAGRPTTRSPGPRRSLRWGRWILATSLILPFAFGTGYAVAALVIFPVADRASDDFIAVPQLVGREHTDAARDLEALGLDVEGVTELPHPFEPVGKVIAQSPVPGQQLRPGSGIRLAISTGRPEMRVPDLIGLPYIDAAALAERLGFTVNRQEEESPGAAGIVLRVDPEPGTNHELPATIVLTVSAPPEPEPDSVVPGLPVPDSGSGSDPDRGAEPLIPAPGD